MRFLTAAQLAALNVLVAAHGSDGNLRHARQAAAAPSSSGAAPPASSVPGASSATGSVPPVATAATTFTFSLQSTNPTAVPLSAINAAAPSSATRPLDSTAAPGTVPTSIPGAPALPNAALLSPSNYPALDKLPPTDSPEVQQWKAEVAASGVQIPDIPINNLGGCPNNTAAASDPNRGWWTCGGTTRDTDIVECPTAMTWGLTYDDGPSYYTSDLLNYLDQQQLKSTFFVVGSRVISFPNILQTQYLGGHQIAVHTWSHPQLTTLSNDEIIAELGWTKKVIKDVTGVTPNMMRPPYGDIDDRVRAICKAMGLTPVMWTRISPLATFDTDDFNIHSGITSVQQVLQNWENILGNVTTRDKGFIVLEHDLFQQTVEVATGYILPDALAHQPPFKIEPVITCLNKPMQDAYIETNDNKTNPPPTASGAAITLSSGAPGSASQTGSSQSGNNGAHVLDVNPIALISSLVATGAGALLALL